MKLIRLFVVCSAAAMLPAAMAQKWEFGVGAGGGFYTGQDVKLGSDSASLEIDIVEHQPRNPDGGAA